MAQKAVHLHAETFSCKICVGLMKDPVLIPCGHSFCRRCIQKRWDEEGVHCCPRCRKRFRSRPELLRNVTLAAVVRQLKESRAGRGAGAEDVACDVCKLKALKSCAVCVASYCETHLQPHRDAAPLRSHQLVDPSRNLQENICSRQDKVKKMFCCSDQLYICYLCCEDEHKDHETVSAAEERRQKLRESREAVLRRIEKKERDLRGLRYQARDIYYSAKYTTDILEVHSSLIRRIEQRRSDVEEQIRAQQEAEVSRVRELQETLELEVAQLRSSDEELQRLSRSQDPCAFLRDYPSAARLPASAHSAVRPRPCRYFEDARGEVSESARKIHELLTDARVNLSLTPADVFLPEEPKTRAHFLKYSRAVTLHPSRAPEMRLSEENRRATWRGRVQCRDEHPYRILQGGGCVMSREAFTGRCYWEVKIIEGSADVSLSYDDESNDYPFQYGRKYCRLSCHDPTYEFLTKMGRSRVSGSWSSTVGVYLDQHAGHLSFYSVSETMTLLHRVRAAFTKPLYLILWVRCFSSAELVKLK